ncbi:hypothetical protein [Oceanobacillus picturae]|uniref:hypothetical protein n=1 Tax=Oceanobacillus picturae TaxID=171693 RepID=UPI00056A3BCC|nr:hypothetical protein [Oceanobacillus picturae]
MCRTCNGTGGINKEHSWGIQFTPCPNRACRRDGNEVIDEAVSILEEKLREMEEKRRISA